MSAAELLALVLGSGIRGVPAPVLAASMLEDAGGLAALARSTPGELVSIHGVGIARAARVAAAFHLGRRALDRAPSTPAIRSAADVNARLRVRLSGLAQEVFVVLALDCRNVVIAELEIARGTLDAVEVHPREVFRPLIRLAAAAAVVVHNHPSGDPTPSADDLALTTQLREVGELVGIPLLDHVVVAGGGFCSVAELVAC
jgi:DNA repair protein RadC